MYKRYHDVTDPEYDGRLSMLETDDPAHADLFNVLYGQLIRNDEALKKQMESGANIDFATNEDVQAMIDELPAQGGDVIGDDDYATDDEVAEVIDGLFNW